MRDGLAKPCVVALASLLGTGRAVPHNGASGLTGATARPGNGLNATGAHCVPAEPCWPTPAEVEALRAALDPEQQRSLRWDGCPVLQDPSLCETDEARRAHPLPSAIPAFSPWSQPLYGLASYSEFPPMDPLDPLWVRDQGSDVGCFTVPGEDRNECMAQTRNNAMLGWEPAFTVLATRVAHVQTAVRFAVQHNLCIMVAGTGHDFINRHRFVLHLQPALLVLREACCFVSTGPPIDFPPTAAAATTGSSSGPP